MSEIADLEARITQALTRIRGGLAQQGPGAENVAALESQLAEEKMANAQLQERVAALNSREATSTQSLQSQIAMQQAQMTQMEEDLQRLRASHADLQDVASQLRAAATTGASAELINRALLAEVEALNARRLADAGDIDAVLTELKPLIAEA